VETVHAVVLLPIFPSVSWLLWFLFASCHSEEISRDWWLCGTVLSLCCVIIIIIIIIIVVIIIIISCRRFSFFPGTSPVEPVVNPTTQASSLNL
jgi:hypothetical protein